MEGFVTTDLSGLLDYIERKAKEYDIQAGKSISGIKIAHETGVAEGLRMACNTIQVWHKIGGNDEDPHA